MAATLRDISRRTGLGVTTVADILRKKPGYRDETRIRVLGVAREVGYLPNLIGRTLKGGRSMSVGVIFPTVTKALFARRAEVLETTLRDVGYLTFMMHVRSGQDQTLLASIEQLLQRRIDALVLYRELRPSPEVFEALSNLSIPVVYLESAPEGEHRSVLIDRHHGMIQAADHLADLGHRRVAFVGIDWDLQRPYRKIEPYRQALARRGVELIYGPEFKWSGVEPAELEPIAKRLLDHRSAITAVLGNNDETAVGLVGVFRDLGADVPGRMSVIGFNDSSLATLTRPRLTTIRQPANEVGLAAAEMVYSMLEHPERPVETARFRCELVIRESTGALPDGTF